MRKTGKALLVKALALAALVVAFAGCSGGGGGANDSVISLGSQPTASASVQMNSATMQLNGSTTVTATFLDPSGRPLVGVPVTFTSTLGTFSPANGTVQTDATGNASIQLLAGTAPGAGIVTAAASVNGTVISKVATFAVAFPVVNLSAPVLGLSDLAPGGSTSVTVTLTDSAGNPYTTPVDVSFSSNFSSSGKATLISPVRSVNGVASSTYTAAGGVGTDTITVSVGGTSVTAPVAVASAAANTISYVSATPTNIALRGAGGAGRVETSIVTFKVLDTNGQPKQGQTVDFSLNTSVGGLSLLSPSGSTAADGTVSAMVQSGVVATPIRVTASVHGSSPLIATQSDQLVVSTGVPAQDGFSISKTNLNPEAWNTDGVKVTITALLSDHFHNPVPDGTAVYFTTSGGSIEPSCTTVKGGCSVVWTSQHPRPFVARGAAQDGRAVILAYAVGEEYFLDLNGNGLADPTDVFEDDSEAFRDDNEDGVRQGTETFIDFNSSGSFNTGDSAYNGVLQGTAFRTAGAPKSKHIFLNSVLVMSSSQADITFDKASIAGATAFKVTVSDVNGNTMPSGTTIAVTAPFGVLSGETSVTVPQNVNATGRTLNLRIDPSGTPVPGKTGFIQVKVTSPSGVVTTGLLDIAGAF